MSKTCRGTCLINGERCHPRFAPCTQDTGVIFIDFSWSQWDPVSEKYQGNCLENILYKRCFDIV